jgi:membrane-bound serine protease (ClpP class)
VAEIFMPGMIMGLLGAGCLITSIVWTFKIYGFGMGAGVLLMEVLGLSIGLFFLMERLPFSKWGKSIMLEETNSNHDSPGNYKNIVGQIGKAVTLCRPTGVALILGKRIDVLSESGFIEEGRSVVVTAVEGNQVRVKEQLS